MGGYVDAYVEGNLEQFKLDNPEVFSTRGTSKGELKAEFKHADEICKYIDNNHRLQQFLSGEKQTIMTGEIGGVPFKIKMDSYSKGVAINDLKCMATLRNNKGEYIDFITPYRYDIQLACYQRIVYQNTGILHPCYIVGVSKEKEIDSVIIHIPQYLLDIAMYEVESNIQHFHDVRNGLIEPIACGKCKYCIKNKTDVDIISLSDLL